MHNTQLVGSSAKIRQVEHDLTWAGRSDSKVLLTGESGVGKEIVARMIHERSGRAAAPLVTINCAGIPDSLLASELFGHTRGSFTDAHRDKMGWLEQAHRGTVFLDEVGEMSAQMQAMLLRFLESGELQRIGAEGRTSKVDVRVITATNRRLFERVAANEFREDLYYRLNVMHIEIPPLRQRPEDVPVLLDHFLQRFSDAHRTPPPVIGREALAHLSEYAWPGNVRELKNLAERLVVRHGADEVTLSDLPAEYQSRHEKNRPSRLAASTSRAQSLFERVTRDRECFWTAIHEPFMARDLTREDLRAVIRLGLAATRGNYKALVDLFSLPASDYKRFLGFLRKHHAHVSVHEFRQGAGVRQIALSNVALEVSARG